MLDKYYREQSNVETSTTILGSVSGETTHARKEVTPATSPTSNTQAYIGLITGVLAMVVLLLACTVFLMIRRGRKKVALLHKHTALVSSSTKPGVTINMKDLKMNMSTPIINNGLTNRSRLSVKKAAGKGPVDAKSGAGSLYGHVAAGKQEYGCLLKKDNMSSSKSGEYTDFTSVNSFQEEVKFSSASFYNLTPPPPPVSRPPTYDVQNYQTPTKTPNGTIPSENYYAYVMHPWALLQ